MIESTAVAQRLIGVDVGGTKVSIATLSGGALSEPHLQPTDLTSADGLIDQLVVGIHLAEGEGEIAAVGVGVPSVIDWATGTVRSSVNIPLQDIPLRERLRERLGGVPVFVDNDASMAALAEAHEPDGSVIQNLVMFTIGTGVGGGIVIDGRIYRGVTGAAPELGHMIIAAQESAEGDGRFAHDERFPQPGSLESLASGRALDRLARARGFESGVEVVQAANVGDERAVGAVAILGHRLGLGIANAINLFDPEVVAIGGGVSDAGDLLLEPALQTAQRFTLPGVGTRTHVRVARSGPRAGVHGAALLAGQELLLGERPRTTIQETTG